ncbi:MAG: hypothetical protein PHV37_08960 [Candidatus Gastranaerophilales bacterium]|nr:hypothetical protein [Candidatus Gastranaerophilales bacterium]
MINKNYLCSFILILSCFFHSNYGFCSSSCGEDGNYIPEIFLDESVIPPTPTPTPTPDDDKKIIPPELQSG